MAVVMYPTPDELEKGRLVLMRVFRNGVLAGAVNDDDLKVAETAGRGRWLGGVNDELGNKPRYSADGRAVEFQLVTRAGRVGQRLLLEADEKTPTQGAAPSLYTYVDEKGATQFVDSLERVPQRLRASATVVKSDVSVVDADRSSPRRPSQPNDLYFPTPQPQRQAAIPAAKPAELELTKIVTDDRLKRGPLPPTDDFRKQFHSVGGTIVFVPQGDHPVAPGSTCKSAGEACTNSFQCCGHSCSGGSCK